MVDPIITVATHSYEKAQIVKHQLELAGIECFLRNINLIQGAFSGGVKVRIREHDLEAALAVIESVNEQYFSKEVCGEKPYILLPIDFSSFAIKSCKIAFQMAEKLGIEVKIIHVYFSPVETSIPFAEAFTYERPNPMSTQQMEDAAMQEMQLFKGKIENEITNGSIPKVKYSYEILEGIPEDRILRFAKKCPPQLIIMGTHGSSMRQHDLIGSVTAEIIERAKVPVLTIPENSNLDNIDNIKNIGYATNFDESELLATEKLMHIFKDFDVWIQYLHIGHADDQPWDDVKLKGLRKYISDKYNHNKVECHFIEGEDMLVEVEKYVQSYGIDMIALTTHRRSIFARLFNPSKARRMLFHTNTPLLVFHAKRHR